MKTLQVVFMWLAPFMQAMECSRQLSTVFQDGKLLMVSSSIYDINTKAISNSLSIFFNFCTTT